MFLPKPLASLSFLAALAIASAAPAAYGDEDIEFDLSAGRLCPGEAQAKSSCDAAVAGYMQDKDGPYARCRVSRAGCVEAKFTKSEEVGTIIDEGSTWICKMACPKGPASVQGEGFRLSAGKKLEKATGSSDGWLAESCTYAKYRGGAVRKVMIAVEGAALQAACGPDSKPQPLLACNTAVDCSFRKEGQPSVRVRKINAICASQVVDGKTACPGEAELAECINGKNIRQFTDEVESVPGQAPSAPSQIPTSASGV